MKIKFKKLHKGAKLPKKATEGSAAYDLYLAEDVIIEPGRQVIPLGFAMEMPEGIQALIDPRSGFSSKGMEGYEVLDIYSYETPFGTIQGICPSDTSSAELTDCSVMKFVALKPKRFDCDVIEGKIDSDYRGGVGVIVHNHDCTFLVKAGTRIAQMTFSKVESPVFKEVYELLESKREGGFGSTGTK